jgi:hypothetical protein
MLDSIVDGWLEIIIDRSNSADDETRTITLHSVGERGHELADELGRGTTA